MKKIISLLVFIILFSVTFQTAKAQENDFLFDYLLVADSNITILNPTDIDMYFFYDSIPRVYNSAYSIKKYCDSMPSLPPRNLDKIDFSKSSVVMLNFHGGDCHAQFKIEYAKNIQEKTIDINIFDHYGGCRAGGRHFSRWAIIPKPEEGYMVYANFIMVEKN